MKIKTPSIHSVFIIIAAIIIATAHAQNAGQSYTIKQGDWLSKIAAKAYENPHLYYRIIEATNEKALLDKSYKTILSVTALKAGQKIWIPDYSATASETTSEVNLVAVPKTNCEIRIWYNYQVVAISALNKKWIADGLDLKTRAKKAYQLRHNARVDARFMMQNKEEVKQFQARDQAKYGNPDGPTFEYLFNGLTKEGHSAEECYRRIIASASKVSPVYNKDCVTNSAAKN